MTPPAQEGLEEAGRLDNAIVVVENIARYLRAGYDRADAAVSATGQIALALSLLATSGLFIKSLANVARVDLGLNPESVVLFRVSPRDPAVLLGVALAWYLLPHLGAVLGGGVGVAAMDRAMRGGKLVAGFPVELDDQIMLATSTGQSIRCPVGGISFRSRAAGGVKVFDTGKGEKVVSVAWIADQPNGDASAVET